MPSTHIVYAPRKLNSEKYCLDLFRFLQASLDKSKAFITHFEDDEEKARCERLNREVELMLRDARAEFLTENNS